ncbi:hypothetical protein H5410_052620, partial [Solanum commersonii]
IDEKKDNSWVEGNTDIAFETIKKFKHQFSYPKLQRDFTILNCFPRVIFEEDNILLDYHPSMDEIKDAVFSLNVNSAPGPYGLSGRFVYHCWDIISIDLYHMICEFFNEAHLSSFTILSPTIRFTKSKISLSTSVVKTSMYGLLTVSSLLNQLGKLLRMRLPTDVALEKYKIHGPSRCICCKNVVMLHGKSNITWKDSEVKALIIQENLQYAIIGKFSYGKSDIMELRQTIPGQCGNKSEYTIELLDTRYILIRLSTLEDYVLLLSTAAFYMKARENYW